MKLYLRGHNYEYAVIQIALSLFPLCAPKRTESLPESGEDSAVSALFYGEKYTTSTCKITLNEKTELGTARIVISQELGDDEKARLYQRVIKQAFYKAAVKHLGFKPAWGALSGVRPSKLATKELLSGGTAKSADKLLRDVFFVSESRSRLAVECAVKTAELIKSLKPDDYSSNDSYSLYIGIPFCPSRCTYCSFVSQSIAKSGDLIEPFLHALELDLEATADAATKLGLNLKTIYIGGGTPTTLTTAQLDKLICKVKSLYNTENLIEFTVEAGRPDTLDFEKLKLLKDSGVTRISVNPQSMIDSVLEKMGRPHSAADIETAYKLARQAGHSNINMDLIAGLIGDDLDGFCYSLDKVISFNPESITVHTLSLKRGSELKLEGAVPSAENVEKMLSYAEKRLRESGYLPYYLYRQKYMAGSFENIGWYRAIGVNGKDFTSPYNIIMMEELHTVLACGGCATTKLVAKDGKISRIASPKYPNEYIAGIEQVISAKTRRILNITNVCINNQPI